MLLIETHLKKKEKKDTKWQNEIRFDPSEIFIAVPFHPPI